MRALTLSLLTLAALTGALSAAVGQDKDKAPGPGGREASKTMTLVGCIARRSAPSQLTIDDAQRGRFQLVGPRLTQYIGQRVELSGTPDTGRLRIKGGLTPTPNVAGQAGAIDPVRAAVAAQPGGGGTGTGDASLPSFRVRSIKTLGGACE